MGRQEQCIKLSIGPMDPLTCIATRFVTLTLQIRIAWMNLKRHPEHLYSTALPITLITIYHLNPKDIPLSIFSPDPRN
jgi:hypothetical protein